MEKRCHECPIFTIDYDAIAKGMIGLMEQAGDTESLTVMRFGMLPKKWLDMVESQLRERLMRDIKPLVDGTKASYAILGKIDEYDPDVVSVPLQWSRKFGGRDEFSIKKAMSEILHELSLAFYSNVDMVV